MKKTGLSLLTLLATAAMAQPAGVRGACSLFLKQRLHDPQSVEWVDMERWSVVKNADGSYSVGARYRARTPAGGVKLSYSTCIIWSEGSSWRLEKISELF